MDVNEIASRAATALVTAMVTDGWPWVRDRVGRLYKRRAAGDESEVLVDLDEMQERYLAAEAGSQAETARDLTSELRALIRTRLRSDPSFAAEFEALTSEITSRIGEPGATPNVIQSGHATGFGTVMQAGRDIRK